MKCRYCGNSAERVVDGNSICDDCIIEHSFPVEENKTGDEE